MKSYNPQAIEKMAGYMGKNETFKALDNSEKKKFYALVEFPYPSGVGLHVGHIRAYTSLEVISRKRRLEGYNVLFPIGWGCIWITNRKTMLCKQANIRE